MPTGGRSSTRRAAQFRCPECGFRAAHAMGLGRHRTARHGVLSQRQQRALKVGGSRISAREFARLQNRVAVLEKRYASLIKDLSAVGRAARAERSPL